MVGNLQKLAACAFPYIILVVLHSLLVELIEGEHFFLANLCKSIHSSSSRAVVAQEDQAKAATGALVRYVWVTSHKVYDMHPSLKRRNEIGSGPEKLK